MTDLTKESYSCLMILHNFQLRHFSIKLVHNLTTKKFESQFEYLLSNARSVIYAHLPCPSPGAARFGPKLDQTPGIGTLRECRVWFGPKLDQTPEIGTLGDYRAWVGPKLDQTPEFGTLGEYRVWAATRHNQILNTPEHREDQLSWLCD